MHAAVAKFLKEWITVNGEGNLTGFRLAYAPGGAERISHFSILSCPMLAGVIAPSDYAGRTCDHLISELDLGNNRGGQ